MQDDIIFIAYLTHKWSSKALTSIFSAFKASCRQTKPMFGYKWSTDWSDWCCGLFSAHSTTHPFEQTPTMNKIKAAEKKISSIQVPFTLLNCHLWVTCKLFKLQWGLLHNLILNLRCFQMFLNSLFSFWWSLYLNRLFFLSLCSMKKCIETLVTLQ